MSNFDPDYFYSLYNTDNGVVIYESSDEAERVKCGWLETVPVDGPFQHNRLEAILMTATRRAIENLTDLCKRDALIESQKVHSVAIDLQYAFDEFLKQFPDSSHQQWTLTDSHRPK